MDKKNVLNLILILFVSIIAYLPIFGLGFTNYDDQRYILDNQYLSFQFENIIYFFTNFYDGHYHPLAMLSLMLDNAMFSFNAVGYHVINLIIHLMNVFVVYLFVLKLLNDRSMAFLTALFFAVFPMGVETVAWLSERKNLLYAFFYLLSLLSYLNYRITYRSKYYFMAMAAFILSLLSKVQAVTLPFVFILIDYYLNGTEIKRKQWLEKIPLFILVIVFIIVAHFAQVSQWKDLSGDYSLLSRIAFASSAFTLYIVKLIFPHQLCALYPYAVEAGNNAPFYLFLYVIPVLIYLTLVIYYIKRNRFVLFALLFFGINIVLLLKITGVPYGNYFMADRYVYVASIGIFLLISHFVVSLSRKNNKLKYVVYLIVGVYFVIIGVKTTNQCKTWENGISLWSNVIKYFPDHYQAHNDLGTAYSAHGNSNKAKDSFITAIQIDPDRAAAYNNLGNLSAKRASFKDAVTYYDKAISIDPRYAAAYNNRGLAYEKSGQYDNAVADFKKAVELNPRFFLAWIYLSGIQQKAGNCEPALNAVNKAVKLNPEAAFVYELKAGILLDCGRFDEALKLFGKLKLMGIKNTNIDLKTGICYYHLKKFDKANVSLINALKTESENPEIYKYLGYTAYNLGKYNDAVLHLDKAINNINSDPLLYAMRGMAKLRITSNNDGCDDLRKAYEMGLKEIEKSIEIYCN